MQPTTIRNLRADFIAAIKAITPTELPGATFKLVDHPSEVMGGRLRNFYLTFAAPTPEPTEIYGDGMTWASELRIYVDYSGLSDEDFECVLGEDSRQIYHTLERRTSPVHSGLLAPTYLGFFEQSDPENSEGRVYGYYSFDVHFLARAVPDA